MALVKLRPEQTQVSFVLRPEGPPVLRPGRQAGIKFETAMSCEGAAQPVSAAPSALASFPVQSRPDGRA